MQGKSVIWTWVALGGVTLCGLDAAYWLLFSLWMMAYLFADHRIWQTRLLLWLVLTVVFASLWSLLAWRLFRSWRKSRRSQRVIGRSPETVP